MSSGTLFGLFEAGLAIDPCGRALDLGDKHLSFEELHVRSQHVSGLIRAAEVTSGTAAVWCAKGIAFYEAYLACAAAGLTIVPIDVATTPARRSKVMAACQPDVVLTDLDTLAGARGSVPEGAAVLVVRDGRWTVERATTCDTSSGPTHDAAYILFTSGSTGEPKGVPVRGESVVRYVDSISDLWPIDQTARFSHTFGVGFDLSLHDMFVAWRNGAALCVPTARASVLIFSYVNERELTHWFSVPSAVDLAHAAGQLPAGGLPRLRVMAFCGEPLSYSQADLAMEAAPNADVYNLYGPTEVTIACTQFQVCPEADARLTTPNGTVPIGAPLPEVEWRTVEPPDVCGQQDGNLGELVLRGPQRFDGYLDPRANSHAFVRDDPDPEGGGAPYLSHDVLPASAWYRTGDLVSVTDGQLIHRGRVDDQVKVSGFRVEPGEVEAAIGAVDGVDGAVVVAADATPTLRRLVAYYVSDSVEPADLRRKLTAELPSYMVPKQFVRLDQLPLSPNGKVDRGALRTQASLR